MMATLAFNDLRKLLVVNGLNLDSLPFSEILQKQEVKYPGRLNPANFGRFGHCFCICEKPGQVPCPSRVKFDKPIKWWHNKEKEGEG